MKIRRLLKLNIQRVSRWFKKVKQNIGIRADESMSEMLFQMRLPLLQVVAFKQQGEGGHELESSFQVCSKHETSSMLWFVQVRMIPEGG
jgi:hypothetical protein